MAEREATIYIADVAQSMGRKNNGREKSDIDWAMSYVWDKLATTISTGRKTLYAGLIAAHADETKNVLAEADDSFKNISVLKELAQILLPDLKELQRKVSPSHTQDGDIISALVLAIHMIGQFCKKLKYKRRIILLTNGAGFMDTDGLADIIQKILEDDIELIVLGADFDDAAFGVKEEDKDPQKLQNEQSLKSLCDKCNGVFGTIEQAVSELGIPQVKAVRPVPSYRGQLTLGDPQLYESSFSIDIERYPRTMIAKAPSASSYVLKSEAAPEAMVIDQPEQLPEEELAMVRNARTYQVEDKDAPGGKKDVERDDLARGYEYGRTAVPISESDEHVTKFESKAGMDVIGFVPTKNFERFVSMDRTYMIVAQRTNLKAVMALSSFVHALLELETSAVARLVTKDNKDPQLILLTPHIDVDYECLFESELPFAEDVRNYKFPPLDKIITVSGKVLGEHRFLPNDDLKAAMEDFVDAMDISSFEKGEEGEPTEYASIEDTFSPALHHINAAIRFRAIHPSEAVPPPHPSITKYMSPPAELLSRSSTSLSQLKSAANVKKVPARALSKRKFRGDRAIEQPRSGLDIAALLSARQEKSGNKIDPENAIPEFKQILETANNIEVVRDATEQVGAIVRAWIKDSFGDAQYQRAVEAMRVMREECIELEEPRLYNDFVRDLKDRLLNGRLGGDRKDMWWLVRSHRVGLIDKKVNEASDVSEERALEFLRST